MIAVLCYPASQVDFISKQPPEVLAQTRRDATITIAVTCFLAGASFALAWRAVSRKRNYEPAA